jgi:hypothetical protein
MQSMKKMPIASNLASSRCIRTTLPKMNKNPMNVIMLENKTMANSGRIIVWQPQTKEELLTLPA